MQNIDPIPEGVLDLFSSITTRGVQLSPTESGQIRAKLLLSAQVRQQLVPYLDALSQHLAVPCLSLELASPGLRSVVYCRDALIARKQIYRENYLGALEFIPAIFLILDNDGIVRFANASSSKLGLRSEEILNQPIYKFFPAEEMVDILWEAFRSPYQEICRSINTSIKSLPRQFLLKACSNQQEYWLMLRRLNSYWT